MPRSKAYLNERPVVPADVLAEVVDLTDPEFPVFGVWKKAMTKASHPISRDAQAMENYNPLCADIAGFEGPVERMMELTPASGTHVFTPIQWNAECVKPPYPNFYLDGSRIVPYTKGLTGYEGLRLSYKGPLVFEEYWNRMIGLWKRKNEARREHAQMIAEMKGIPLEFEEFTSMPYYKMVPESHRVRRFQMNKLKIICRDYEEEVEANRRRVVLEQAEIEQTVREANATRHITAEALSHLDDNPKKRAKLNQGPPTEVEIGSPKRMKDVDEFQVDLPALEVHEAQIAALTPADGSAASANEHSPMSTPRRNQQKMSQKSPRGAVSALPTVRENSVPPSDAASNSYRSMEQDGEEVSAVEIEQSEPVPPIEE
eukprot:1770761-Amphidinium_carterae.1